MMFAQRPPAVSVIIPVYNVEAYVAEAIQSVLDQSFQDFEIIIVDDGGTDASISICETFADSRIQIISQANRGLAGARNTGIAAANGRYIALLDSDDAWSTDKLARHVEHLNAHTHVGVSYAGSELMDADSRRLGICQQPKLGAASARDVFFGRAILNGSAPVFRLEMLEEAALATGGWGRLCYFDETLRRSEDVECWTRLALTSRFAFEAIPGTFTYYRVNSGGLSADVIRQLSSWDVVCVRIAEIAPDFIAANRGEARARELRYLARRCVQMGDRGLGLTLALEGLKHCPSLLLEEPTKTVTTVLACLAMRVLPRNGFDRLLRIVSPALFAQAAS